MVDSTAPKTKTRTIDPAELTVALDAVVSHTAAFRRKVGEIMRTKADNEDRLKQILTAMAEFLDGREALNQDVRRALGIEFNSRAVWPPASEMGPPAPFGANIEHFTKHKPGELGHHRV